MNERSIVAVNLIAYMRAKGVNVRLVKENDKWVGKYMNDEFAQEIRESFFENDELGDFLRERKQLKREMYDF